MEMSHDYLRETADALTGFGFALDVAEQDYDDGVVGTTYALRREGEHLVLEVVTHPEEGERYFLEIVAFHGLRSYSVELDSWKHRPDRIELKYYALPGTGRGLSLILQLDGGAS